MAKAKTRADLVVLKPELVKQLASVMARLESLSVETPAERKLTGEWLNEIVATHDEVEAAYEPEYRARKSNFEIIQKERNAKLKMLKTADSTVRSKLIAWEQTDRARREEARQAEIAAEQKRLAKQIKRETGEVVEPSDLVVLEPPPTWSEPIPGQIYVENWQGECLDLQALVKEAAADPSLVYFLSLNASALNDYAKKHKERAQSMVRSLALRFFDKGSMRVEKGL